MLSPVVAHTTPKLGYLSPDVDFETLFARLRNFVCFTPLINATGSLLSGYLAALLVNGWEGAQVRAKTEQSDKPLELFLDNAFNVLLKK